MRDAAAWQQLRGAHVDWLGPWEATLPPGTQPPFPSHRSMVRAMLARAKAGQSMPFAVTWDGAMVGLVGVQRAGPAVGEDIALLARAVPGR